MILVTGSSGTVGSEVVKELAAAGQRVRAAYRSRPPSAPGVEGTRVDLATGEGLDGALKGVDAVFLLVGETDDQAAAEIRVVDAAKRAGVKRLVKLSVFGAAGEAYSFAKIHRRAERAVEASGIPYTLLRPVSFMQNFVNYYGQTIRESDAIYLPCGDVRESHVDARDIARVAAAALTRPGHEGRAYDLTGPQLMNYHEAAAKLSEVLGRRITYVSISDDDYEKAMADAGVPADFVARLLDLHRFIRAGGASVKTTCVEDVTGREPLTFDAFARDYAAAWRRA